MQFIPTRHRPHVGSHVPALRQHVGGPQGVRHRHAGGQDLGGAGARLAGRPVAVHPAQQVLDIEVLRLGGLEVGLVVDGDVEEHVLRVLAEHPVQPALDDMGEFVGERRVVGHHRGVGRRQQHGVAVGVLQTLAGERGAPRGGTQHEAAGHLVGGGPEAVTGALEAEHRVEDVDGDHRLVVRRVGRADRGERRGGAGLVDALVQDLALLALLVGQHQLGVDGGVELTVAVVDLQRREPRVHAEGPGLVGDDRHDAPTNGVLAGFAQQFLENPHGRHGGGHGLVSRAGLQRLVDLARRQCQSFGCGAALGQETAERGPPVEQVPNLRGVRTRVVVRREVRVLLQLGVTDGNPHEVPEILEVLQRKLFHLVGGVAALEVRAECVALDGLGQDHRRLTLVIHRGAVGGIHLAVVVAAALEVPDLGVGHVLHERLGAGVAAEEVLADVGTVIGLVRLEVPVRGGIHQVHQRAVLIGLQQGVPLASPHHLDDVPAGAAEERLQFLDDLAVAANRPVEALKVAVDHEGEVVQRLVGGDLDQSAALRLVHLAVAEECPDMLVGGVLDTAVVQVVVEPGLVDGVHRTQAHRHRRELPEVRHQPGMRIGRKSATGVAVLLAEAVKTVGGQPALEEGAGIDSGRRVALDVDLVAATGVGLAAEEVVETHLVERCRRRVGGDVPADTDPGALGAMHHDGGVPSDPASVAALDVLVTGEPRFQFGGNGVDIVRRGQRGQRHALFAGPLKQAQHQVSGTRRAGTRQQVVERLQPLRGLLGVDIGQVGGDTVANHPNPIGFG